MKSNRVNQVLLVVVGLLLGVVGSHSIPALYAQDEAKPPKWMHAHELRVRKAGELDFTKDTKKYSIEVFEDTNNGNLIYISETGSISVVPGQ